MVPGQCWAWVSLKRSLISIQSFSFSSSLNFFSHSFHLHRSFEPVSRGLLVSFFLCYTSIRLTLTLPGDHSLSLLVAERLLLLLPVSIVIVPSVSNISSRIQRIPHHAGYRSHLLPPSGGPRPSRRPRTCPSSFPQSISRDLLIDPVVGHRHLLQQPRQHRQRMFRPSESRL